MAKLQNNKWLVEKIDNQTDIVIEGAANQSVYIFGCKGSLVTVKGKVNAITLDSCQKTGVIFDTSIAALEIVNCKSAKVQVQTTVPAIQVDNSAGVTIYLSASSLATEVYTSKSTEVNLNTPKGDDTVEWPVPSQFVSRFKDGKWVTESAAHAGA
eukprot:TRINITY_DN3_c0_g1_i1.p2 TRINITY_DN3_c0_g1~~TRINITY_DN3_c0_g1_i1.p2  ORF type:complete len:168 (-),score=43.11 TRINITY_DN3_c0_g1_i1:76-540(-)